MAEFITEKRKLLYWIAKWTDEEQHLENINVDLPELSVMLQAMGFRLESFDKAKEANGTPIIRNSGTAAMHVELTCPKSGMRSSLIKQTTACKCPSEEETAEGQFWVVSGYTPASQEHIDLSNSSLLPAISSSKFKIISSLLAKILTIIGGTESNQAEEKSEPFQQETFLSRHRSLDTLKTKESSQTTPKGLKRRPSWEVDPKTSPPTQTSSPLPMLCNSLSQISIGSGQAGMLVKNLETIRKLAEETLELASGSNATFVKSSIPKKRVSDIKPVEGPSAKDLVQNESPAKAAGTTPRKRLTPKKTLGSAGEKRQAPPSRIAMLRKKTLASGTSSVSPKVPRMDTPRAPMARKRTTSGGSEGTVNSKYAVGVNPRLYPPVNTGNDTGACGIKPKSAIKLTSTAATMARKKL